MTRWESNMLAVAVGYLDAQATEAARMVLAAVLKRDRMEQEAAGMPQDGPGGAEGSGYPSCCPESTSKAQRTPPGLYGALRCPTLPCGRNQQ